jgi:HK97 gp10 family phage protein
VARDNISMQIFGIEDLKKMLKDYAPNEARNILRQTVHGLAGKTRDVLKRRVKKRYRRLQRSIKAVRRRSKNFEHVSEVRGGRTAPYGFMLEYGTSKTRAQPFITPGVEELRPKMAQIYRDEFGKQLERVLKRRAKMPK